MKHPGTLELPVLGLLKERPMHGYELRKQVGAMLGPLWQVSWGSLYPTLRRLAKSGAVERDLGEQADSKAGGRGRRKTVYRITPAGEELFTQMLEETAAAVDAEHFSLKLAFFRYLRPETRLALLERRRAYLQDKLAQFKANFRTYRERMDSYALSKVVNEKTARAFALRSGADIYALRIGNVIEPHEYAAMVPKWKADPEFRKKIAWSYIDARDLGQITRLAIETDGLGFQIFNAANDDTSADLPTRELLQRFYRNVPVKGELDEFETLLSNRKIREMLGFRQEHPWRGEVR